MELVTHVQSAHHVIVAAWLQRSFPSVYRSHIHISSCRAARSSSLVSACTFRRICSAFIWRGRVRLWIGEFVSPDQIVSETFRVCKIILHTRCGRSLSILVVTLPRHYPVWLSDHQATLAAQRRSELRHHLLRDVQEGRIGTSGHFFIVSNHKSFLRCCFSLEFGAFFGMSKKSLL